MDIHEQIKGLLVDFALRELSEQQSAEVEAHLTKCQQCSGELRRLQAVLQCAASRRELSADEQMCESAKQALLQTVAREEIKRPTGGGLAGLELLWRMTMSSRTVKFAAAVVVIVTILSGVTFWPRGSSRAHPMVWAIST